MARSRFGLGAVLCLGWTLAGPVLPAVSERQIIDEAGQSRVFDVAVNEVELPQEHRLEGVAGCRDAEEVAQHAERLRRSGRECRLVLYEAGRPRNESTRRILTRQAVWRCRTQNEVVLLAEPAAGRPGAAVPGLPGWYLSEATTAAGALELAERLRRQPGVLYAQPLLARKRWMKLAPNDPLWEMQWHLRNTGQLGGLPGLDLNLTNVWDTWRGAGIVVGIVDDGLEMYHPDLAPNYRAGLSWDFNGNDPDPSPSLYADKHGTPVAGVAAARGDNGVGVAGVAFEAGLAGLRLLGATTTDAQDAAAMLHSNAVIQVKNNSWGAYDGDGRLEGPGPLMASALAEGTASGRAGKGTFYIFAGGNGRAYGEDVNYDGYANSIHVLAVGAVNDVGEQALYSEPGACLAVSAPSSPTGSFCSGGRAITTVDLTGEYGRNYSGASCELPQLDYTQNFTGTSAAAPSVAGVVALLLQARPQLSYRDVKEVLMRAATRVSPGDDDWWTNSAGLIHSHRFGSGLVDARRAIDLAIHWTNLGPVTNLSLLHTNLNLPVPDNDAGGVTNFFLVANAGFRVEHAALTVTLPHARYGDLAVALMSPDGTQSRLAEVHSSAGSGYNAWTLTSVRHWGAQAAGVWQVRIADRISGNAGTLHALHLQLHGSTPQAALSISPTKDAVSIQLSVAAPGWRYHLDASPDLKNWTPLGTVLVGDDGQADFLDTSAPAAQKFYRARLGP